MAQALPAWIVSVMRKSRCNAHFTVCDHKHDRPFSSLYVRQ